MKAFAWLLISVGAVGAAAVASDTVSPLRLVRCASFANVPCLRTDITLSPAERMRVAALDSASEPPRWSGELAGTRLVAPGVRDAGIRAPARVLVLLDRRSGMAGAGIAFARISLKGFLAGLDTARTRVVLTAFGDLADASAIDTLPLVAPARASAELDTIAAPAARGPGVLAAVLTAAAARAHAIATSQPDAAVVVLVLTSGPDIAPPAPAARRRRGRSTTTSAVEPQAGNDSLVAAMAALSASGQRTSVVQLGTAPGVPDVPASSVPAVSVQRIPFDPNALANLLTRVTRELHPTREMVFGFPASGTVALARGAWAGTATLALPGGDSIVHPLAWHPPVFALPVYQGVAEPALLTPAIREALLPGANTGGNGGLIAVVLAIASVALWLVVPKIAWARPIAGSMTATPTMSTTRIAAATREAAPRKPEDITHQTARRTAMHR